MPTADWHDARKILSDSGLARPDGSPALSSPGSRRGRGEAGRPIWPGGCGRSGGRARGLLRPGDPGALARRWRPPARPGEGRAARTAGRPAAASGEAGAAGIWRPDLEGSPGCGSRRAAPGAGGRSRPIRGAGLRWIAGGRSGRSGGLRWPGRPTTAGKEKPRRGGRGLWGDLYRETTGRARRPPDRPRSRSATRPRSRRR
jgi:hypothetical protein